MPLISFSLSTFSLTALSLTWDSFWQATKEGENRGDYRSISSISFVEPCIENIDLMVAIVSKSDVEKF